VSDSKKHIEELQQDEGRLEELLFLVDPTRRPRIQKILAFLRSRISALTTSDKTPSPEKFPPTLTQLRQRQADLEEKLFQETPEGRLPIKQALKQVRTDIADAEAVAMREADQTTASSGADKSAEPRGPSQVA
jgi:hypothetical protein